jgi:SagB-type dehydrogenase family enzyme
MVKSAMMALPKPLASGRMSVEEAIAKRRSIRDYLVRPIATDELSQVVWAAQGITNAQDGYRAAPSAGALYPLEVYISVREGGVVDVQAGVYHYGPEKHVITLIKSGDCSSQLQTAAYGQEQVGLAAVSIVLAGVLERAASKYGDRAAQYVFQESGHAAENVYLQSTALGLGTVVMGAFDEEQVSRAIGLRPDEKPLCIMPIGFPRS